MVASWRRLRSSRIGSERRDELRLVRIEIQTRVLESLFSLSVCSVCSVGKQGMLTRIASRNGRNGHKGSDQSQPNSRTRNFDTPMRRISEISTSAKFSVPNQKRMELTRNEHGRTLIRTYPEAHFFAFGQRSEIEGRPLCRPRVPTDETELVPPLHGRQREPLPELLLICQSVPANCRHRVALVHTALNVGSSHDKPSV
jgi:hypothetical protein